MRARHVLVATVLAAAAFVAGVVPAAIGANRSASAPALANVPAERLHPPGRTFTVAAVGDFLSEDHLNKIAAAAAPPGVRYDYEPLLRPVEDLVQRADLAICHMETPIGRPGTTVGWIGRSAYGTSLLAAAPEAAKDLRRVGFDRCSTASNHANDLGLAGIDSTLAALDAAGLGHRGTARTQGEAAVTTFEVNGVRVAHLAYARNSNTGFPRDAWRLSHVAGDPAPMQRDIARARALGAEVVIVSLHVYVEMQKGPTADDRAMVTAISGAKGADLVVVHGPHVVQPVERVRGTLVFWSVGNFISAMGVPGRDRYTDPRTLDGLLATVRFTQRSDGSWSTRPWTVLLCNTAGDRLVYPAISWLRRTDLSPTLRAQLQACVARSSAVVQQLK